MSACPPVRPAAARMVHPAACPLMSVPAAAGEPPKLYWQKLMRSVEQHVGDEEARAPGSRGFLCRELLFLIGVL